MKSLIQKMVEVLKETEGIEQTAETLIQQAYDKGFEDGKEAARQFDAELRERKAAETDQQKRDRIVKQAKEFVEKYRTMTLDNDNHRLTRGNYTARIGYYTTEFHFKNNKVTAVVCGLKYGDINNRNPVPREVDRAKCNPGDCFNKYIGKAIALHRALGLNVPQEYSDVPNPTEVRVGNRVLNKDGFVRKVVYKASEVVDYHESKKTGKEITCQIKSPNASFYVVQITDDSESEPNDH